MPVKQRNSTGSFNTAVGHQALLSNTSNSNSTGIGRASLQNSTGGANTALGSNSGNSVTSGVRNVLLGWVAGGTTLTTGDDNVIIGSRADIQVASQNDSVIIGSGASGGNQCVVLGTNATSTANNQFVVGSSTENAGSVTAGALAATHYWTIKINGTDYNVLLNT